MSFTSEEIKLVHEASEKIESTAISFGARVARLDSTTSKELLLEAADNILSSGKSLGEIKNLSAYLFVTYKRLVISWCKKKQKEEVLDENQATSTFYQDIERKILVEEIVRMMNAQERFIYNYLVLGYTYEEIVEKYNQTFKKNFSANVLRSKLSKATQRISKELLQD